MAEEFTFDDWRETNPVEFSRRVVAGEAGNKENPMIAARIAYNAGVRAGLRLASERLAETIWDTNIKHTDRFGDVKRKAP